MVCIEVRRFVLEMMLLLLLLLCHWEELSLVAVDVMHFLRRALFFATLPLLRLTFC